MMNGKRFLALVLSLCMILTLFPVGAVVKAEEPEVTVITEELTVDELDSSAFDLELAQNNVPDEDLAMAQELADENGMVDVIIVMEGESIIEEDANAVMNEETQEKIQDLEAAQADVVAEIEDTVLEGETLEVSYNFTWLTNAVAACVPYNTMNEIAALDGVEQVIVEPVYEIMSEELSAAEVAPMTISDGVMVGRESAWAKGYTGQGIRIAVIDTGLDTDHPNFGALSEDKLTADSATLDTLAAVIGELNASARYASIYGEDLTAEDLYLSTKVAYAFNYADDTLDVTHSNDNQSDHGTHVAGIAAANQVEEGGVVGVAPDAQLYIMKVFGLRRAGLSSDIIAALEDALILGADVVNMSLGSTAGFTSSGSDYINSIYARAAETGTVLSVSAGNNYTAGLSNLWGTNMNTTDNPDNAVIGEPGAYNNVMSVASVENWKIQRNYIQVSDGYQMGYVETSASYDLPSVMSLTGEYGVVAVPNYGAEADYEDLDVTGKVVLVSRGEISFPEKVTNASNAGAAACLVYNNTSGEIYMDLTDHAATIPCASITLADGSYLISALAENSELTVSFPTEVGALPSADAYQMSDFSSWGVAPDLTLEPDITAPGGNIYSTIDGGAYGLMSGTSMAAPNVSGISALVLQYVKETFPEANHRTLVQNLLMSTSAPLTYEDSEDLYYSPRQQGSGLANAFNAITTGTYLTVEGCDVPKAELFDDIEKTGSYSYAFNVHNFGESAVYYTLNTVAQSEDVVIYEGLDEAFMSGAPVALNAAIAENSQAMVLLHDVDDNTVTNSHDAYIIYQTAMGNPLDENWTDVSFRYDTTCNDAVDTDDVQAYLDALVGNESVADLTATALCVEAGEEAQVSVSIALSDDAKAYLDEYYVNGGYVEGYTFLTAMTAGAVDLSLPYLAFYGNWDAAPIIDDGNYWDLLNAPEGTVVGNQYYNVLWTNFQGYAGQLQPGYNVYVSEPFDPAHISVSPNEDGYFDTVDEIYLSLLRNAESITFRYSDMATGEVVYEQSAALASKSVYNAAYEMVVPTIYSWFEGEIALYDWKDAEGNPLANNTQLLLEVETTGVTAANREAPTDEPDVWSVPITVDLEAPKLLNASRVEDPETGKVQLVLTFKDNVSVSAVIVASRDGSTAYYVEGVEDTAEDEFGYQNYTMTFDITGISGKLMVILSDYAMNETYYGLNAAGEGTPYGDLVGFRYDMNNGEDGWVSFSEGVSFDETLLYGSDLGIVSAEYVNGYVFAQDENSKLYGFRYEDMLKDTFVLESTYVAQLDFLYQDLAYNYADGKLYGMTVYMDGDYPYTEIDTINIRGAYYDPDMWMDIEPYQEDYVTQRGGLYGLGMAIDDAGNVYVLGPNYDFDTETMTENAHLWTLPFGDWALSEIGALDVSMDYLQSMTWNHNNETLYWARFDAGSTRTVCELYTIDPADVTVITDEETGEETSMVGYQKVGDLNGEICALFAPLSDETAAQEAHLNVPEMDSSVVGTPILRQSNLTMNVTGTATIAYDLDPWYTEHKDVVWSSSDESILVVDENGLITAVAEGSATITVANAADESKFDTCDVEVTALDLVFEGIITAQEAGLGNNSGTSLYKFEMVDGLSEFTLGNAITASEELNYGLSLATSAYGRDAIWACEYGNTGMIYQINPATGEVVEALQPIAGDMLFGMAYSEGSDTFTGIMNMYLYLDLKLTQEEQEDILNSYDEELGQFTYHKLNMLPYLIESNTGFVTGEDGQGASSEIVFCAVTAIEEGMEEQYMYMDYLGGWGPEITYMPDQTLVLMDNVGRLWFIDEIFGTTMETDEYGNVNYVTEDGYYLSAEFHGLEAVEMEDGTYSVIVIRELNETKLTDMFRDGTLPRITYHFSDIAFAGFTADGAPMIAMSLYDFWNNGTTNELYLYVPGVGTGEFGYDENWNYVEFMTEDRLYDLGDTGEHNIIASIHSAVVTGGVDPDVTEDAGTAEGTDAETTEYTRNVVTVYGR